MEIRNMVTKAPYFSVCIPQHNRTSFLLEALRVLAVQRFRDFEVCIADDCSTDGREEEVIDFLNRENLSFVYRKNERNLRYDGNVRACIALASGRYCILHGNDDCLKDADTLARWHELTESYNRPSVITTNFESWADGVVARRVPTTALHVGSPEVAATRYRNVAFVTGVTFDRELAVFHATDRWDGSEMYQMYLMARIVALGGALLEIDESLIRKDIQIRGEEVDSYASAPVLKPCPIVPRQLPLTRIGRVVADAIRPGLEVQERVQLNARILRQLYTYTFPPWVVEYRRTQSWKYAVGLSLGLSPRYTCAGVNLSAWSRVELGVLHFLGCSSALLVPPWLYYSVRPMLYSLAKRQ